MGEGIVSECRDKESADSEGMFVGGRKWVEGEIDLCFTGSAGDGEKGQGRKKKKGEGKKHPDTTPHSVSNCPRTGKREKSSLSSLCHFRLSALSAFYPDEDREHLWEANGPRRSHLRSRPSQMCSLAPLQGTLKCVCQNHLTVGTGDM